MKAALCLLSMAVVIAISESDNCVTYFEGCKLSKGECLCGETKGCTNTFPYKDRDECEKDKKGNSDPCHQNHCKHGLCIQTWRRGERSYKCDCTASGYYGVHCQHSCDEVEKGQEDFPAECIEVY